MHLLRGSPGGLLTPEQVREALLDLGVTVSSVAALPPTAPGEQRLRVEADDGEQLLVKVMGRDAWDAQYVGSMWVSLPRRGEPPRLTVTRRERVQHEAMVTLLAERAGVPVLPVVTAGQGLQGEAMIVTAAPPATLAGVSAADVSDDTLRGHGRPCCGCTSRGSRTGRSPPITSWSQRTAPWPGATSAVPGWPPRRRT